MVGPLTGLVLAVYDMLVAAVHDASRRKGVCAAWNEANAGPWPIYTSLKIRQSSPGVNHESEASVRREAVLVYIQQIYEVKEDGVRRGLRWGWLPRIVREADDGPQGSGN